MAIVTLLTDSGTSDHYVAAIKARIISINQAIRIEDITHDIKPGDIGHAAFVLRAVFRDFPRKQFTWSALMPQEIKMIFSLPCS